MAYNTDILDRLDELADSQPELLSNFADLASFLQQDHVAFNTADAGKHKQLTMPLQTTAIPTPSATEYAMLCGQRDIGGNGVTIQNLLGFQASGVTTPNAIASYSNAVYRGIGITPSFSLRLPSGILIKWTYIAQIDLQSIDNSAKQSIAWSTAGSNDPFTTQYWAYVSPISQNPNWSITGVLPLGGVTIERSGNSDNPAIFTVYDLSDPTQVKFLAFMRNPGFAEFPTRITKYTGGLFCLAIGV